MKINKTFAFFLFVFLFINLGINAQNKKGKLLDSLDKTKLNWYNLDPTLNKVQGVSVDKAYLELLKNIPSKKKITVAVIDSGVDTEHEDLQGKIWVNADEIPNNGIDDDNNGYIDDINGWNFLGNSKDENIQYETYEFIRVIKKLEPEFINVKSNQDFLPERRKDYETYLKCKKQYQTEYEKQLKDKTEIDLIDKRLTNAENLIKTHLKKESFTNKELEAVFSRNEDVMNARYFLLMIQKRGFKIDEFREFKDQVNLNFEKYLSKTFEPRNIIGDNIEDINDKNYGNNNLKNSTPEHGTFVSGIIAGNRNNNIGINGIADNVEIMVLRAVPDGDERDKDVALAIRYAVDNGANIINMSFGKDYSPQKQMVDEAIKYAEEKNVLLIHSAGNEGVNLDVTESYPTFKFDDGKMANNYISVGATQSKLDKHFCGIFSNYGKQTVHIFAPGVDILSLYPDNKYNIADGTSFSGPVVSGVCALVWSYYPELTASELKNVVLNSSIVYPKKKVLYPNIETPQKKKTEFTNLSITGGIVNAYEALKLADKLVKEKITN